VAVFVVRKKSGDRFIYKGSRVQKWQMFSESDRRGIYRSSVTLMREKSKAKSETQTLLGIWTLISHKKPETLILA
jgi:hypothetical protein